MEDFISLFIIMAVIGVLEIATVIFSVLFMHFSAKHRNHKLSLGWYICGVIFGFWTLIVFLVKRTDFPGPEIKVCYQCSDKFPETFQVCPKCLIGLPEINPEEKKKEQKLSRIFGISVIITYVLSFIAGIALGAVVSLSDFAGLDLFETEFRISVDGVYYDKMGNSYEDENSVVLYDEDGNTYIYTVETKKEDGFEYEEVYYVRNDGQKYFYYDCYVTEEGWFYCDKGGILEMYEIDTSTMTEEELDAYYNELMEGDDTEYRYYDYPYTDAEGNIYFDAYEASWNEKGELITAENDVSLVK